MQILLVEDDQVIATLVADVLETEGHHITSVRAPDRALTMLAAGAWDLVITDSFGADYAAPDETEAAACGCYRPTHRSCC